MSQKQQNDVLSTELIPAAPPQAIRLETRAPEVQRCICLDVKTSTLAQGEERDCAFTDQQQQREVERVAGGEGRVSPENTTIRCAVGSHCFGLWEKSSPGEVRLVKQGCWNHLGDQQSCSDDRCVVTNLPPQIQNGTYHFCCCGSDMCNVNFTEDFPPPSPTTAQSPCKTGRSRTTHHAPRTTHHAQPYNRRCPRVGLFCTEFPLRIPFESR
ncbi:Bone morphogenetic protein receptor type-2 [Liparis tanakae]|uniref:Bone morphogenetic protein receptor type-2 n=1 Tax=Liparis tanakae TaxID=230148 RepID=A0A4Z2ES43_9TELE|nr:Bone morphogenetic protein receptor type-2 [Liparis tanakae]